MANSKFNNYISKIRNAISNKKLNVAKTYYKLACADFNDKKDQEELTREYEKLLNEPNLLPYEYVKRAYAAIKESKEEVAKSYLKLAMAAAEDEQTENHITADIEEEEITRKVSLDRPQKRKNIDSDDDVKMHLAEAIGVRGYRILEFLNDRKNASIIYDMLNIQSKSAELFNIIFSLRELISDRSIYEIVLNILNFLFAPSNKLIVNDLLYAWRNEYNTFFRLLSLI